MIKINSLNKFFNKGKQNEIHVINDISLELPEKGMVSIFGKSGCGKTTLLNVIGGLDGFSSGEVSIEGKNIRTDTDMLRNKYIGYIFQNYNLNMTENCFDNVADALRLCGVNDKAVIEERVMCALKNVGMDKYAKRMTDTLSGGQQQRIAIARAIVKAPKIILADEPTGNLDEANTVMIMELLKAISAEQLVILVTHEEELVEHYCDLVIELSDGKAVSTRENFASEGFRVRDKNAIYLGELEKKEIFDGRAVLEYYGEEPKEPLKLTVVNKEGKLYLQVLTPKVQVLDEFSEVKLIDGVYEQDITENGGGKKETVDMSKLPPIEGKNFGKLFSFPHAVKSGYAVNFKKGKKGKNFFKACMSMFASVIVIMSAIFGTSIADIAKISDSYNHNTFYVYTPDGKVSALLNSAVGDSTTGVESVDITGTHQTNDVYLSFNPGSFETFSMGLFGSGLNTEGVVLGDNVKKGRTVAGTAELKTDDEAVITTKMADKLLKKSSYGYIKSYDDMLGIICNSISMGDKRVHIVGVVESNESVIYLTPLAMAKYNLSQVWMTADLGSQFGYSVKEGEVLLVAVTDDEKIYDIYEQSKKGTETNGEKKVENLPNGILPLKNVGDTVKIRGKELVVAGFEIKLIDYNDFKNDGTKLYMGNYSFVSDEDYIAFSKQNGETDSIWQGDVEFTKSMETPMGEYYEYDNSYAMDDKVVYDTASPTDCYTKVYSSAPKLTAEWLEGIKAKVELPNGRPLHIVTPDDNAANEINMHKADIVGQLITMVVILAVMSVCMYFIMRSAMMSRVKELGILRAIGVSKKNLVFRAVVETAVLTVLTVFVGYVISSAFVLTCLSLSATMANVFFYPLWYALSLLALISGICLFFGILPVLSLLRKTPSQILAKYDI